MIFAPAFSFAGFFLLFVFPLLSVAVTATLAGICLIRWGRRCFGIKTMPLSRMARRWCWGLAVFSLPFNVWAGYVLSLSIFIDRQIRLEHTAREKRQNFILKRDFQYGELQVPRGSQILRYEASDRGEPSLPLSLSGLKAIRFSRPVEIAAVWGLALDITGIAARIELAQDQVIRPVFTYGSNGLERNRQQVFVACKRGQIARFDVPAIDYDIVTGFGQPAPAGPEARFKPSQWRFLDCESDEPITLPADPAVSPPHDL